MDYQAEREYEKQQEALYEELHVKQKDLVDVFNEELDELVSDDEWLSDAAQQTELENDKHLDAQRDQLRLIVSAYKAGDFQSPEVMEACLRYAEMRAVDVLNYLAETAKDNTCDRYSMTEWKYAPTYEIKVDQ